MLVMQLTKESRIDSIISDYLTIMKCNRLQKTVLYSKNILSEPYLYQGRLLACNVNTSVKSSVC